MLTELEKLEADLAVAEAEAEVVLEEAWVAVKAWTKAAAVANDTWATQANAQSVLMDKDNAVESIKSKITELKEATQWDFH